MNSTNEEKTPLTAIYATTCVCVWVHNCPTFWSLKPLLDAWKSFHNFVSASNTLEDFQRCQNFGRLPMFWKVYMTPLWRLLVCYFVESYTLTTHTGTYTRTHIYSHSLSQHSSTWHIYTNTHTHTHTPHTYTTHNHTHIYTKTHTDTRTHRHTHLHT